MHLGLSFRSSQNTSKGSKCFLIFNCDVCHQKCCRSIPHSSLNWNKKIKELITRLNSSIRNQQSLTSLPRRRSEVASAPRKRKEKMEMEILGLNLTCAVGSLAAGQFPEKQCLLPLISKILGYCIVAGSTTVKLPQIIIILKHSSIRGLSLVAFELEVVGYTIALSYCLHKGLPFSAYGELAFLLIQAIILVAIMYYYSRPIVAAIWIRALLYCALAPTILAGQIDPILFEALYASQHAIFFFAVVPQIWANHKNKSTGELSFLTCFLNFAGSIVRVFTSIQENAPLSVTLGSVLAILLNGTILRQILLYQKPAAAAAAKKEKKVQ